MATAELAACLPVLVLLVAAVLAGVAVMSAHVRAQDAAREVARALARGDDPAAARIARSLPGARVRSAVAGEEVRASVTTVVTPLGGLLPSVTVREYAAAAREPDVSTAGPVP